MLDQTILDWILNTGIWVAAALTTLTLILWLIHSYLKSKGNNPTRLPENPRSSEVRHIRVFGASNLEGESEEEQPTRENNSVRIREVPQEEIFEETLTKEQEKAEKELKKALAKLGPLDRLNAIKALKNLDPEFEIVKRKGNAATFFKKLGSKLWPEYDVEMKERTEKEKAPQTDESPILPEEIDEAALIKGIEEAEEDAVT